MTDVQQSVLFHNGFIHSSSDPFATALFIENGVVAWIGEDDTSKGFAARADRVIDLGGALVAPAFVDSHVHVLETALALRSVDVSPSAGGSSVEAVLDLLKARADSLGQSQVAPLPHTGGHPLSAGDSGEQLGHGEQPGQEGHGNQEPLLATGYDDSGWEGAPLTHTDLETALGSVPVYVPRADLHSALCTSTMLGASGLDSSSLASDGRLIDSPHTQVRNYIAQYFGRHRDELYRSVLTHAAALGVVALHENSAPGIDTREGLAHLLDMTRSASSGLPLVVGYRGELVSSQEEIDGLHNEIPGLSGLAGDLSVDGSFGSHSAALREEYSDKPGEIGTLHISQEQVRSHLEACSRAGVSAGFHVIGNRALDTVLAAARQVAQDPALRSAMRRAGHRLEHVELVDSDAIDQLIEFGFMVSVQPAFDAFWGGDSDMYAARLGAQRAAATTPIRLFTRAGVPMSFGSDAPVTPIDPWDGVAAAVFHHNRDFRISARAAFKAHTRGGWRLAGEHNPLVGELRVGAPAHLAVWRAAELGVQAENDGRSSWSTDARSGSPLLPVLEADAIASGERPLCLATLRDGVFVFDELSAS